jgi:hypothetical protein
VVKKLSEDIDFYGYDAGGVDKEGLFEEGGGVAGASVLGAGPGKKYRLQNC